MTEQKRDPKQSQSALKDFLRISLVPLIINKLFMLYFGLNYAEYPGEGYGYGLIASILFLILSMLNFLWKYKDVEDPW